MKRSIWGIGILIALLVLSVAIAALMQDIHCGISDLLSQAATAAEQNDWQQADLLARQAEQQWQRYHHFTAANLTLKACKLNRFGFRLGYVTVLVNSLCVFAFRIVRTSKEFSESACLIYHFFTAFITRHVALLGLNRKFIIFLCRKGDFQIRFEFFVEIKKNANGSVFFIFYGV